MTYTIRSFISLLLLFEDAEVTPLNIFPREDFAGHPGTHPDRHKPSSRDTGIDASLEKVLQKLPKQQSNVLC